MEPYVEAGTTLAETKKKSRNELTKNSAIHLVHKIRALVYESMDELTERRFDIQLKPDGSPVTSADTFLQDRIERTLREEIPDLKFIAEENGKDTETGQTGSVCAILDPIDGTENFCSGLPEWGVALTIWKEHKHLASMLLLPELNRHIITGDEISPITSRIHGHSSSMCQEIADTIQAGGEHRIMGCAVYNLYNVILGTFASFTNPKGAKVWDLLPGLMLALEHGCQVKVENEDYHGRFLDPSQKYRVHVQH